MVVGSWVFLRDSFFAGHSAWRDGNSKCGAGMWGEYLTSRGHDILTLSMRGEASTYDGSTFASSPSRWRQVLEGIRSPFCEGNNP